MAKKTAVLKNGQILIISLILLIVATILSVSLFGKTGILLQFTAKSLEKEQAIQVAEAGVENALWKLNQTAGAYTGPETVSVGSTGTFSVSVATLGPNLKRITSTGFVPDSTNPNPTKQTIVVEAAPLSLPIAFPFAIHSGTGGIELSTISTINGEVFSNKTGAGSIIGTITDVINGNAYAAGQFSPSGPNVPPPYNKFENHSPIPELSKIDYNYWITEAQNGGSGPCSFPPLSSRTIGPWECTGNVSINTATVTLTGPLHITGNLDISSFGTLNLDESFGSTGTVVVVEGSVTVQNIGKINTTSATPKGYILIASREDSALSDAVRIGNIGVNALFHAPFGKIFTYNFAQTTALVGKTVEITNWSTVNYDSSLKFAAFSKGAAKTWTIKKGSYQYK